MEEADSALIREIDKYLHENLPLPEEFYLTQPFSEAPALPVFPEPPELDITFCEAVLRHCKKAGMEPKDFYRKANLSRQLFNALTKHKDYRPTRTTVFACVIALELSLEEAKDLLLKAGYAFSRSCRTDVIIQYFIENSIYDIDRINEVLYYYDLQPLGSL